MFKFNTKYVVNKITNLKKYQVSINTIVKKINLGSLEGTEMMGWVDLIENYNSHELLLMKKKAIEWQKLNLKYIVVVGIGGSYVGVRAAIDMCCGSYNEKTPEILWVHNIAASYLLPLLKKIHNSKFAIIVNSKSGTTLEPALGFRLFREQLQKNVGISKLHKYIVAVTDYEKGTLHDFAKHNHITTFGLANDIGGRFSTLTAVGMFLMIVKGLNPLKILQGAKQARKDCESDNLSRNSAYLYACYRHYLYNFRHLSIENFIVYEPCLEFVGKMWQQIFGESEGKEHKALFPALSLFTTDLHSMGQYFQEGTRNFFETTLIVNKPRYDIVLKIHDDNDKLKYLNNKSIDFVNRKAFEGTIEAHTKLGKVNNFVLEIDYADEWHFGYLFYWFATAVTISGYLLKINPFNQPGVETYKNNMFKLLGRKK